MVQTIVLKNYYRKNTNKMQRLILEIYSCDGTMSYPVIYESKESLIEFLKPKIEEYTRVCAERVKIIDEWRSSKSFPHNQPELPAPTHFVAINGEQFYLSDIADDMSNILTLDEFFAEVEQSFYQSI
jgi:hypothetical protein